MDALELVNSLRVDASTCAAASKRIDPIGVRVGLEWDERVVPIIVAARVHLRQYDLRNQDVYSDRDGTRAEDSGKVPARMGNVRALLQTRTVDRDPGT